MRRSHADHRLGTIARDHGQLAARARSFATGEESNGAVSGRPLLPSEQLAQ
ncbi:hypothetical protein ACWCO0_25620 [Streptomyces tubercidicus]|uniref:hypothetical protein n=1 Tax=Streptomyces tubercidicus TaxID=47759 RepID=UPI0022B78957|nr:hypothetical protein [Streptomyces tubercidicus]WAU10043.1 hypothetical protein STRTU_000091 [Streptomyces tubercidicus]